MDKDNFKILTRTTQDLICLVHIVHNCSANRCSETGHKALIQERRNTGRTHSRVLHVNEADGVLNTAKTRDSVALRVFDLSLPVARNLDEVIKTAKYNHTSLPVC